MWQMIVGTVGTVGFLFLYISINALEQGYPWLFAGFAVAGTALMAASAYVWSTMNK